MTRSISRRFCATFVAAIAMTAVLPALALAASPASFTTDSTGTAVNANHYADKCDVYLNGGPDGADVGSGGFTFYVLQPGGQASPTGDDLLSNDSATARTFWSTDGDVTYGGGHPTSVESGTEDVLISLCDPALQDLGYADTSNPGGVYILAVCTETPNPSPSQCKYDAFKVTGTNPPLPGVGTDLTAIKTADGAFTRTFGWDLTKDVDKTYVQTNGNTATFNYTVTVTKSAGTDSGFVVTGAVTVFNTNDAPVTGVAVTDAIGTTTCTVSGGSSTIAAGGSATFDYSCSLTGATAGTNTATVTWDHDSINSPTGTATATAPFDFTDAPTPVNDCTTVTDTFNGTATVLTPNPTCSTRTYTYSHTVNVPATGCATYTNTAVESATGDSDSETVQVCRTNSNGFTIGYWQNKNGQAKIKLAATGLCAYLAQYSNVLSLPASCNSTSLAKYVYDVIKLANAAGTGAPMFRAQFLATALNVYFSPSLGTTGVVVPTSIEADGCMTVNALLTYGNAKYATLSADKTFFMVVKSIYDNINNNQQVTC